MNTAGVLGMIAAILSSIVESIGDYYACARLCGTSFVSIMNGYAITTTITIYYTYCHQARYVTAGLPINSSFLTLN